MRYLLRQGTHSLAEALVVDYLALAEEPDNVVYVGVIAKTQDIVVGDSCLLLCCKILVEVGEGISL